MKLEIDTGADLSFRINNPIVVSQNLLRYFKNGVKSTGRGAGGEDKRMWVNFDSATFSGIRIKNTPVALSFNTVGADADPASNGVIGGEFTFVRRGGSGLKPGRPSCQPFSKSRTIIKSNPPLRIPRLPRM